MYYPPEDVHSPQRRWKLIDVLFPGESGTWAVAIGSWDKNRCLAVRWNGDDENPLGSPNGHGNPTWFVADKEFWEPILSKVPAEKQALARSLLDM
jgi:hypothetical protein